MPGDRHRAAYEPWDALMDDESRIDPRAMIESQRFDEALLYDFAKFMTTLALLGIGGLLTLTQTADKQVAKPLIVGLVAGSIAAAGVLAVSAAAVIAKIGVGNRRSRVSARQLLTLSEAMLGMGAGGFLTLWWKTL